MDLHYEVSGNGEPIILLHSGGADVRDWTFVTPLLSKHFKVITFDGRGVGNSPDPSVQVNYVEDLKNLLDYFQLEKDMLVGQWPDCKGFYIGISTKSIEACFDRPQRDMMVQMQMDYLNRIIQWPAFCNGLATATDV
ncbi:alpha/beta fold hydrolase [Pseudalkalibacillus sp. R45]|uniref:alpha/beta fold hydrolase n=1 Tax=Pseudalkalibacillus sp. R45 TaxID=3457433 RepID=UPI003FCC84F6